LFWLQLDFKGQHQLVLELQVVLVEIVLFWLFLLQQLLFKLLFCLLFGMVQLGLLKVVTWPLVLLSLAVLAQVHSSFLQRVF